MIAASRPVRPSAGAAGLSALALACLLVRDRLAVSIAIGAATLGNILAPVRTSLTSNAASTSAPLLVRIRAVVPPELVFIPFLGWGKRW